MTRGLAIRLHEVSVRRGDGWALRNVSLSLAPGERWLLTGSNGAGKTQLLKLLAGDVWPTPMQARPRSSARAQAPTPRDRVDYFLGRQRIDATEAKPLIAYLGAERQDRYARYDWNFRVRDILATGLQGTDILLAPVTGSQSREVERTLSRCGITALASRRFLSLSYGQQRLTLLARALIGKPHWLLLDELYNGLDARYRQKIDVVLARARRRGQAWMIAAHRGIDVPRGTQRHLRLDKGEITRCEALTRASLAQLDEQAARVRTEPTARATLARSPSTPMRVDSPRRARASRTKRALIAIRHADLYVGYRRVLHDLNWELRRGEHWAVVGANGAGKSSFLKLLYGDLAPALGGEIERAGFERGMPIEVWKRRVAYISADLQSDYAIDVSIEELVASGKHASVGLNEPMTSRERRHARRLLQQLELLELAGAKPRELSYGQLRRALFARAMSARADILLFDEPMTGLDPSQREVMRAALERGMVNDITVVIAVHHATDLPAGITHCLHLHKQKALAQAMHYAS